MGKSRKRVAIQGVEGSFHEWAASLFFHEQELEILPSPSFRLLANWVNSGEADTAIMAIENTLAGSILPNYALIEEFKLWVSGEIYLPIHQCLLALPGQAMEDLLEVRSHPMALLQCTEFLDSHPWMKPVEHHDTAESAKEIAQQGLKGVASIASARAATLFGLEVVAEKIETNVNNFTRFLVLEKQRSANQELTNKAMVSMQLLDQPGTLLKALEVLKKYQVNMTKIQSLPIVGQPYTYSFHADLEWEPSTDIQLAIEELRLCTERLSILGMYKKGIRP